MSQGASLSQSPFSSVGVMVDPLSLATVPMDTGSVHSHTSAHLTGDSPQPPYTLQRTHPIDPKYGESVYVHEVIVLVLINTVGFLRNRTK